jgi:hypothetical protein
MNMFWVKSSLSFSNGNCVEVAELPGGFVGVRNSRDPQGPVLKFTRGEWDAFIGGARLGDFDRFGNTVSRPGANSALPEGRYASQLDMPRCWLRLTRPKTLGRNRLTSAGKDILTDHVTAPAGRAGRVLSRWPAAGRPVGERAVAPLTAT